MKRPGEDGAHAEADRRSFLHRPVVQAVLPRALAVSLCGALFVTTVPPDVGSAAKARLAARFTFTHLSWSPDPGSQVATVREVNPSLQHIRSWISAVGASVALGDVDGDSLSNDVCAVDPRTDTVTVSGVPGERSRFAAFRLRPTGLDYNDSMAPMGCVLGDLNEDGHQDALVYYWGRSPVMFLRRSGIDLGTAAFDARELVASVPRWFTNAALLADIDGDGHQDVIVANYFPDGAHVLDRHHRTDEQMQDSMSRAFNGGGTHFFLGAPTPTGYVLREAPVGLSDDELHGWTLAMAARDLDGDLLPELYLANDFGPDRLLSNRSTPGSVRLVPVTGRRHFTTPASRVLGHDSFKGMGVDFGDLDGDGRTDIFVSNITTNFGLHESNFAFLGTGGDLRSGSAPFDDHSERLGLARSGWGWDTKLADFDNDGAVEIVQATGFIQGDNNRWPELHELAMGNDELLHDPRSWPNFQPGDDLSGSQGVRFFVRDGARYQELAAEVGLDRPTVSRGIAVADVDGDEDLDFAVANQWDDFDLYRNDCERCGHSLTLRLRRPLPHVATGSGPGSDEVEQAMTTAVGATATVVLPDGRQISDWVDGGSGHSGKRTDELHIGLGDSAEPVRVTIAWRDLGGEVRSMTLRLAPGRHTIVLPNE